LKVTQYIKHNTLALLAIGWLLFITGCRDFQDHRTPYKSFVVVALEFIKKSDKLDKITIQTTPNGKPKELKFHDSGHKYFFGIPLEHNTDSVSLQVYLAPNTPFKELTINYQKEAVLISHQCGATYKYTLKEITLTKGGQYKIINKELSTLNDSQIDLQIYW